MALRKNPGTRERTRRALSVGCPFFWFVFFGQAKKMNERPQGAIPAAGENHSLHGGRSRRQARAQERIHRLLPLRRARLQLRRLLTQLALHRAIPFR